MTMQQYRPHRNPGVAAVLSFFIAGLGQIYNGELKKGFGILVLQIINVALMFVVIGFVTAPITAIFAVIDAYKSAERLNRSGADVAQEKIRSKVSADVLLIKDQRHKTISGIIGGIILLITLLSIVMHITHKPEFGCVVPNTSISYSVIAERLRQSDVEGKYIKECYILLSKQAPSIADLTQLAAVLGKNNNNIEFFFYDDARAYQIGEVWEAAARDSDIPQKDRDFYDIHSLGNYLKASTRLTHNILQPTSDIYRATPDENLPEIIINN